MKYEEALFYTSTQKFSISSKEKSEDLHPRHVLVRPLWVGICGSDLVLMELNLFECLSLGHEWIGEVSRVGKDVTTLKPGDLVTSAVLIKCGYCPSCIAGKETCDTQYFLSNNEGMLKTIAELPEAALLKLSGDINHNSTLFEILAVAENVHTQIKDILHPDKKVLIIGAGTLGLSTGLVMKHYGFEADIIEPIKSRIERARNLGLRCAHPTTFMIDPSRKGMYDIVIDASGDHLNSKGGWSSVDHFGAKHFTGVILAKYSKEVSMKAMIYFMKNATLKWIQGCTNDSLKLAIQNWSSSINEIGKHMVSHVYDFSEVNDGFDKAREREDAGRVIIKVQDKA